MLRSYRLSVPLLLTAVFLMTASQACADPIEPNLIAVDFNFSYASVNYDAASGELSGAGSSAAVTFEPVLGGATHPVFNLSGAVGGALTFDALFDHAAADFDVDGFFTTLATAGADLTLTGKIPTLGIEPNGTYTGTLLEAEVIALEMYGDAGTGAFAFNGYFRVTGGDLLLAGYLAENDTMGMRSWLSSVDPSLPQGFDFASDFSASTHLGELGFVPEPGTFALALLGCGSLALLRRRRGK